MSKKQELSFDEWYKQLKKDAVYYSWFPYGNDKKRVHKDYYKKGLSVKEALDIEMDKAYDDYDDWKEEEGE